MEINLDPRNYTRVSRMYDNQRGYAKLLKRAQEACGRKDLILDTELDRQGVVKERVFTTEEAADLVAKMPADKTQFFDRDLIVGLLPKILNPAVDRQILSYFQSEYVPVSASFYRDTPETPLCESDGWHCDGGPSKHLVMMIYLTPTEANGARTVFGERGLTDVLKHVGYIYCELRYRQLDLDPLTDAMKLPRVTPFSYDLDAGEMIVFDAPNVVHKRLLPKEGQRVLLALAFIPSVKPWQEVVATTQYPIWIASEYATYPPVPTLGLPMN